MVRVEEGGVKELAQLLFTNEPKSPNTIQIVPEEADANFIFEILCNVLLEGMYIMYGREFDVGKITPEVIYKMNDYMKSMGFEVKMYYTKQEECYSQLVYLGEEYGYIFVQYKDAEEKDNLSEYYINVSNLCQLGFEFYYG